MRIHQEYASDLKKNPSFNQLPNELQEWIANDILQNFEIRQKIFRGKGVIVVPNRVSGYALIETIIRLNPEFVDKVKVLSVSNSPQERTMILEEFRHQSSPLSLIIVTANWLTGYDNPLIHSIYLLARISGVNLYQLVGRVSRLYPNKECGVVVDYLENDWNDLSDTFDQVEITI
ncbi:MAG: hypothetical protein KBG20_11405 [Caldilineaceae bacterium]|nr:hypothetical protein [Caldilineaceae bacterium]